MIPRSDTPAALEKVIPSLHLNRLEWRPFPPRYILFLIWRGLVGMGFSGLFLIPFFLMPHAPSRWFFLLVPVLAFGGIVDRIAGARRAGYSVSESFVAVRQGFFRQRVEIMPMEKVDVAMQHQSPWWRRRRLVSMAVKGMVHAIAIPMVPRTVFEEVERTLAHRAKTRLAAKALAHNALNVDPEPA